MLTKEDYLEHLAQIDDIESKMAELYQYCLEKVEDEFFRKAFETLSNDEKKHDSMVRSLMALVRIFPDAFDNVL